MTTATVVAVIAGVAAYGAFIPLALHGSGKGTPPSWWFVLFGVFGLATVVILVLGFFFDEDMSRIGLTSEEKSRWRWIYFAVPPAAVVMYWRRHVRPMEESGGTRNPSE
jgi:hypothetical protein